MTDEICPFCGMKGVDITTCDDARKRFICIGADCHEWTEGQEFQTEPERPGVFRRLLDKFS